MVAAADWVASAFPDWDSADSVSDRRPDYWGRFPSLFTFVVVLAYDNSAVAN